VLYLHSGFLQDQAVSGNFGVNTAEEFIMVIFEVVTEEGESETAASLKGSMAGAAVTAEFSEEGGYVFLEVRGFAHSLGGGVSLGDGREGGWFLWGSEDGWGSERYSECHGCE